MTHGGDSLAAGPRRLMIRAAPEKRLIRGGKAPPQWGTMKVMLGHHCTVPVKNKLMTARAVSKRNSNMGLGIGERGSAVDPDGIQGVVG